jgi:hypothetical protein
VKADWIVLATAMTLVALLSGCSDGRADGDHDTGALGALDDVEVETSSSLGAIKGVIVDEAIRPIAGANVTLSPSGAVARSDEAGVFVFNDLAPGTYFLSASVTGFGPVQSSADVVAGDAVSVRLQLQRVFVPTPRHDTVHYQGFMPVYLSAAGFVAELLVPGATGCICTWELNPDQNGLTTFVYEVTGQSATSNPTPVYGTIYWEFIGEPGTQIQSAHADFPVLEVMARDAFSNDTATWTVRVTGSQWVHVNTSFDVYVTMWYNSVPPEGWSFVAGDP